MSDFNELGINEPRWYVVHTYSGYENKVKANLEKIVENRGLQNLIIDIKVPVETVIEDEKEVENKVFPSYVLIKMLMSDESWHVVRNVRGVTGFVGPGSKPIPLTDKEVETIGVMGTTKELEFGVGDSVSIIQGSLTGFIGVVNSISADKKMITVTASMFGRETSVELEASSVKKL